MSKGAALTFCSDQTGQLQHAGRTLQKNGWCSYCLPPVSEKEQQDHTKLHSTKSQANFRVTLKVLYCFCVCIPKQFIAFGALLTPVSQSGV